MERELYCRIRQALRTLRVAAEPRQTYSDRHIVEVLLWAALHDRPIAWTCQAVHWPTDLRPRPLISQSQMSRRLRTVTVQQHLMATRTAIERSFGNVTSFAGGLGPLPAWVRRPHRVALWVAAKFIIDATRRIKLRQRKSA